MATQGKQNRLSALAGCPFLGQLRAAVNTTRQKNPDRGPVPLRLQGTGVEDGSYTGGNILLAYRPDLRIFYMNGTAWYGWGGGDWARLEANLIMYGKEGSSVPEPATVGLSVGALTLFALYRRRG